MDEGMMVLIEDECERMGIAMLGVADAEAWEGPPFEPWPPEAYRPKSIFNWARSVIVLGMPVTLPIVDSAPSINYHELYRTVNAFLDQSAYLLSERMNRSGARAVYLSRDGYGGLTALRHNPRASFSHRHAAYLAGLGTFGLNNMLLTEEYGPRVRFVSVMTDAELPYGTPMDEDLCIRCLRCVRQCPVGAVSDAGYPNGLIDKDLCRKRSEELYLSHMSPCGICIKVCPVGNDRERFGRQEMGVYIDGSKEPGLTASWEHLRKHGGSSE